MPDAQRGHQIPHLEFQTAGSCHVGGNQTKSSGRVAISPAPKHKFIQGFSLGKWRGGAGACLPEGRVMEEALEHGD